MVFITVGEQIDRSGTSAERVGCNLVAGEIGDG